MYKVIIGFTGRDNLVYACSTDGFNTYSIKVEKCTDSNILMYVQKNYINFGSNQNTDNRMVILCKTKDGYKVYWHKKKSILLLKSSSDLMGALAVGICNGKVVVRGNKIFMSMNKGNILDLSNSKNGGNNNGKQVESMDRRGETVLYKESERQGGERGETSGVGANSTGKVQENRGDRPKNNRVIRNVCGLRYSLNEDPAEFKNMINLAKMENTKGDCVDEHSEYEYSQMKCISFDNGKAGVAVERNGNITSVFKSPKSHVSGFMKYGMYTAIDNGGDRLDCYAIGSDGGLAELYCRCGFVPVCKIKFNKDFAPKDWDYNANGEPDIVFMAYIYNSAKDVLNRYGTHKAYTEYTDTEVPYIDGYEDNYSVAAKYRDMYIDNIKDTEMTKKIDEVKNSKGVYNTFKSMYNLFKK